MFRPTSILWPLLLLLVMVHQRWSTSGEDPIAYFDLADSSQSIRGEDPIDFFDRADEFCPVADAIAPCVCMFEVHNDTGLVYTDLVCSDVQSEEELANVFQQEFPVKEFRKFHMSSNDAIHDLGNILNGVTFEVISLAPGTFVLQSVSDYILFDNRNTLTSFDISASQIQTELFPFDVLPSMQALVSFAIKSSKLAYLPKLDSPTIRELKFSYGNIDALEPGTFDDVPNLSLVDLRGNLVTELKVGTLAIREGPMAFLGYYNQIEFVEPGAFSFFDAEGAASNEDLEYWMQYNLIHYYQAGTFLLRNAFVTLFLNHNRLKYFEPGTFVLPEEKDLLSIRLSLYSNLLTTFDEAVFGELMPYVTDVQLQDNQLTCGCDIAWLITNPDFMARVNYMSDCHNTTLLSQLNVQYYIDNC